MANTFGEPSDAELLSITTSLMKDLETMGLSLVDLRFDNIGDWLYRMELRMYAERLLHRIDTSDMSKKL